MGSLRASGFGCVIHPCILESGGSLLGELKLAFRVYSLDPACVTGEYVFVSGGAARSHWGTRKQCPPEPPQTPSACLEY